MYEDQRLQQATNLIQGYKFEQPLIQYLSTYFRANKKLGSRDRRQVRELVYDFYRIGSALPQEDTKIRIAVSHFLRNNKNTEFSEFFSKMIPVELEDFSNAIQDKVLVLQKVFPSFSMESIFPSNEVLSLTANRSQIALSILNSSITWIRSKRTHIKDVRKELEENKIKYVVSKKSDFAIGIDGRVDFDKLRTFKKGYFEVQDLSSQLCVDRMSVKSKQNWWDACCGSGGKALLVKDQGFDIHMTMSDNRKSILRNLKKRLKKASVNPETILELDVSKEGEINKLSSTFDRIMIDAPCSGSGTWARNPEWIASFDSFDLKKYNESQKFILQNALTKLNAGGELYYITCSVFKSENEDIIASSIKKDEFKVASSVMINCIPHKGDNLFISVIKRI